MENQNQPRKKLKAAVCIICSKQAYLTDKNELYSKLLINELIPPSSCSENAGFKAFDFCIDCLEIMEHFHELHDYLNFVLKMIKEKKTEIIAKILINKYEYSCLEEISFRKLSTRGFCPRVEIVKNNELMKKLNETDSSDDTSDTEDLQLSHSSKERQNKKIGKLRNCRKLDSNTDDAKESDRDSFHPNEDSCAEQEMHSPSQSINFVTTYTDDKIRSDLICIEPKHRLPFNEEESAVEFEPWKNYSFNDDESPKCNEIIDDHQVVSDSAQLTGEYCSNKSRRKDSEREDTSWKEISFDNNDDESNSCYELIEIDDEDEEIVEVASDMIYRDNVTKIVTGQLKEKWEKPPLTAKEMCILAILASTNMQLTMSEILAFVSDNFPYYQTNEDWKNAIRVGVYTSVYITGIFRSHGQNRQSTYVINKSEQFNSYQKFLRDKLLHLSPCMAFPDRISSFLDLVLRPVPEIAHFANHFEDQAEISNPVDILDTPPDSSTTNTAYSDGHISSIGNNRLNMQDVKTWCKPSLSYSQLSVLAILSSDSMSMWISEILDFVSSNFPYFESFNAHIKWKHCVRAVVCNSKLITRLPCPNKVAFKSRVKYAIKKSDAFRRIKLRLYVVLNEELTKCMAFPERLSTFRKSLERDIPDSSSSNNASGVTSSNNVQSERSKKVSNTLSTSAVSNDKVWERPPLSMSELCILAIMCSDKIQLRISEIYDFISCNFPHFISCDKWKQQVRIAVYQSAYVGLRQNSNNMVTGQSNLRRPYVIIKSNNFYNYKNRLVEKLVMTNGRLLSCLAFPERLPFFRKSLMKEIPEAGEAIEVRNENSETVELIEILSESENEEESIINKLISNERLSEALREEVAEDATEVPLENYSNAETSHGLAEDTVDVLLSDAFDGDNSSSLTLNYVKTWSKPILTYEQLCVVAIMNSTAMVASFQEIYSFVTENFPYYKLDVEPSCEVIIKIGLARPRIRAFQNELLPGRYQSTSENDHFFKYVYTVKEDLLPDNFRIAIAQILSSVENLATMEFPDRVHAFIKNVMARRLDGGFET